MKQVIQDARSKQLKILNVPEPLVLPGYALIANACSVISAGTEKMVIDETSKSMLTRARQRPDLVRAVLLKLKREGLFNTMRQVMSKLGEPIALGYSSAGVVLACGEGVQGLRVGDRVASNGPHAAVVCVPRNLCAVVPGNVPMEQAAFAVIGSIALQGVRLAHPGLNETVFVIGLGLLGQIAVRLLKLHGCRVIGTDLDAAKCELARKAGADFAAPNLSGDQVMELTGQLGADAVLITAATSNDGPITLAGAAVRKKGRVVLVGAVGMHMPRQPYYLKEAEFVISCSYGPGRYDATYEDRGKDYPAAYVRWTENRNMQTVLDLMGRGQLDLSPLITHRFAVADAAEAYKMIETGSEPYLGIVLGHEEYSPAEASKPVQLAAKAASGGEIGIGCLGVGGFAKAVLLPAIQKAGGLRPRILCNGEGLAAVTTGEKMGFDLATPREDDVFADPNVRAVFIVTRHNQHARLVLKALRAGMHAYTEKPLAVTLEEVAEIQQTLEQMKEPRLLMVGFNRRFSPAAIKVKEFFRGVTAPLTISIRFNSGFLPADHWTQDQAVGGGRMIGEGCHAIDLATYLAGSPPVRVYCESVGGASSPAVTDDQCFLTLRHANGAVSSIAYLSGGDKAYPKERVEVLGGGRLAVIDDFREVITSVDGRTERTALGEQDKGHNAEVDVFARRIKEGGEAPIPWPEIRATSIAAILAVRSMHEGVPFDIPERLEVGPADQQEPPA